MPPNCRHPHCMMPTEMPVGHMHGTAASMHTPVMVSSSKLTSGSWWAAPAKQSPSLIPTKRWFQWLALFLLFREEAAPGPAQVILSMGQTGDRGLSSLRGCHCCSWSITASWELEKSSKTLDTLKAVRPGALTTRNLWGPWGKGWKAGQLEEGRWGLVGWAGPQGAGL